ncbi:unnamed protein product [Adineta ricciae]|uniref:Uncharacterized protein n=1 Tax=Adineta ricciae TaxID=249248 RepID=A0A815L7N2_ADIRI|nr:unnamed protein product [Adineta ricciae]
MWKKLSTVLCHKDSDNEFETNNCKQMFSSGPSIIHQQPRLSISKWLCTSPPSINKSTLYPNETSLVYKLSSDKRNQTISQALIVLYLSCLPVIIIESLPHR